MKRTWLTRVSFTILILLLTLSVSGWTGSPASIPAAPNDGNWTGTTNLGRPVAFTVSSSGTMVATFSLSVSYSSGSCSGSSTSFAYDIPITNNQFSKSGGSLSFTGQFTSNTTATGTYSFTDSPFPVGCGSGTQTGTWTAQIGGGGGTIVPSDGPWNGTTSQSQPVSFTVAGSGTQVNSFMLTVAVTTPSCSLTSTTTFSNPIPIANNQFSASGGDVSITGQFTSNTAATGTYSYQDDAPPFGCGTGLHTGTWTAAPPVPTFADVAFSYWAHDFIERLYNAGITGGCNTSPLQYCPEQSVTRAQMAVFLLRGIHGSSYAPPGVGAGTGFGDVPSDYWAATFINQLAAEGITSGCGGGNFCPEQPVTRAQMAVFLLKAKNGAGYVPPAVGSGTGFGDVPPDYWAAAFIKQLVTEGITAGCGSGNYCPENAVTRAEMAVFLVRTFSLP